MSKKKHGRRSTRHRVRRRTPPGAPPGAVVADPSAPRPVIRVFAYGPEHFEEHTATDLAPVRELLGKQPVTWVDVAGLGDAEVVMELGGLFHIHPLALEDVVNVHQRAKVDSYGDNLFLVVRSVGFSEHLESEQISVFLGKGFLVTFQERPGGCLDAVCDRLRSGRGKFRDAGADYLAYAVVDAAIDSYYPVLEHYAEGLEVIEEETSEMDVQEAFSRIHEVRSDLLLLRRSIWPHRETLAMLTREHHPLVSAETRVFLRDCYDHAVQLVDLLETYREICTDLRDYSLSVVTTRTNDVMKWLTIIATVFIPLSFIAGLYGMNFDHQVSHWNMPELHFRYGYPAVLVVMAAVAAAMLYLFRRRGWIGGRPARSRQPTPGLPEEPAEGPPTQ